MNTTAFDFRRFWQVLKWTILTEKKSILTTLIAFITGFLVIQLYSCFTISDLSYGLGRESTLGGIITCVMLFTLMCSIYATGVLGNARTSRQRTTALMLPASNAEKFTARIVYCCLLMPLVLVVAFLAATYLRMLLELIFGHQGIIAGISLLKYHFSPNFGSVISFAVTLWSISLMVLGGVFFRNRPFVWTYVTLAAATIVISTLAFYLGINIGEENIKNFLEALGAKEWTLKGVEWGVSIVLLAFTVLNVWISYRLFKGLQVVQHKWFNI